MSDQPLRCCLQLFTNGFTEPAKWVHLKRDAAVGAVDKDERPGSLLLRMGLGSPDEATSWTDELAKLDQVRPYELRAHVYQARNLPAADDNGASRDVAGHLHALCDGVLCACVSSNRLCRPVRRDALFRGDAADVHPETHHQPDVV